MTLIFPLACDLDNSGETLRPGFESRCSCEKAAEVAKSIRDEYVIVPAACKAPGTDIDMSEVMGDCIVELGIPEDKVRPLKGQKFNTEGEVVAVVEFLLRTSIMFHELVICCKWWHMPRTWFLTWLHFKRAGIKVPIRRKWCKSQASWLAIAAEFGAAWPINILRVMFRPLKPQV